MNGQIEIEINRDDRNLLLKELNLPAAIQQVVRFGWGKEESRFISLDLMEWIQVVEVLMQAHVMARAGRRKEQLWELADYIMSCTGASQHQDTEGDWEDQALFGAMDDDEMMVPGEDEPAQGPLESLHPEMRAEIDAMLQANPARSLEEVETTLRNARLSFFQKPLDVLGGVSLVDAGSLLIFEINSEKSPLHLSDALTPDVVLQIPVVRSARTVLDLALASGGLKLRADKTLAKQSREKIIEHLGALMPLEEEMEEHQVEALGAMAGMYFDTLMGLHLLEPKRGKAVATAEGKRLAQDEMAPKLFQRLFVYLMARVGEEEDWEIESEAEMEADIEGFLDADEASNDDVEISCFQAVPYFIFRLSQVEEWLTRTELTHRLLSPALAEVYEDAMHSAEAEVFASLMVPLLQFGLLEAEPANIDTHFDDLRFRKSPLFDQFISFDWGRVQKEEILESRDAQAYIFELLL